VNGEETIVVLGAGASRGVSYGKNLEFPSPLDYDFFDLLQRLKPESMDSKAVKAVLRRVNLLPRDYWRSFERSFYTMQLKAYLSEKFEIDEDHETAERIVTDFALCVHALLRKAHGKTSKCASHQAILTALEPTDTILTFNYDLVVERALKEIAVEKSIAFGKWLYGLAPINKRRLPLILKLHGSSNWRLEPASKGTKSTSLQVRTRKWQDLENAPGYARISTRETTAFPIFLPFWDKRVEAKPWVDLWKNALQQLRTAQNIVVWGYSLPPTDVKAYVLFDLGIAAKPINLCVIDPSRETKTRWRNLFPEARFWQYSWVEEFLEHPPEWFKLKKVPPMAVKS
jgi:hypothetical protein